MGVGLPTATSYRIACITKTLSSRPQRSEASEVEEPCVFFVLQRRKM
jgi:hypothetical protein